MQFGFTPTLKQRHLLLGGLQHRAALGEALAGPREESFMVFKQYPIVQRRPSRTPCLQSVGVMAGPAGRAYGCNKSSSAVYIIARYEL